MITRADVADLREGDVVEFRIDEWPESHAIRATLQINQHGALVVPVPGDDSAAYWIRGGPGQPFDGERRTLTVVSRAPRPLYVNHPRTDPVPGDVVRAADSDQWTSVWICDEAGDWWTPTDGPVRMWQRHNMPPRLRLLVDGETGQVVPS